VGGNLFGKLVASFCGQGMGRRIWVPAICKEESGYDTGGMEWDDGGVIEGNEGTTKEDKGRRDDWTKRRKRDHGCIAVEIGGLVKEEPVEEKFMDGAKKVHNRRAGDAERKNSMEDERAKWKVLATKALTRNKAQLFPTTRRPQRRLLASREMASEAEIEAWFGSTALHLGIHLNTEEVIRAKRMLYTWRDVFETDLLRIRRTDLIEHAIVLRADAKPYRARIPLYTEEEIAFCRKLLRKMEEAGLIFRCDTEWGARTKFPLKPRADTLPKDNRLRMVHNFIPLNRVTEKSQYPCPRLEQIVYTVLKKGKRFFFTTDAANSYWAIPVRPGDETKLGFVTPYGMYCYNVMGQGLTGGTHTYSRFRDLVFGAIPSGIDDTSGSRVILKGAESLIGDKGDVAFDGMIDDSYGSSTTFDAMFDFLHEQFFPRCVWGPMYLKDSKSYFFCDSLDFVGLEAGPNGLRPSLRKRETMLQWPTPASYEEVEAFCYLTSFLRRFIPGRAELVRIMKYGLELNVPESLQRNRDKVAMQVTKEFNWNSEKETAFQAIKQAISNNAMALPDPSAQYHLALDASKRGIGGVLFQLAGLPSGTEAGTSSLNRSAERVLMFISFRLTDVETRYSNSEREALAVIRCLAEVRWMVMASKYPVIVYTDHSALRTLLTGLDNDAHGRIARWQERLGEYNLQLLHRSAKTHFMGMADGLSRLPTRLLQTPVAEDSEALRPLVGTIVPVKGWAMDVMVNSLLAVGLREDGNFWKATKENEGKFNSEERLETGSLAGATGGAVLEVAAMDLRRRRWREWLESKMYGAIVQARLDEIETGKVGAGRMDLGRSAKKALERLMRRYILMDSMEPRLFFREKNGELASCVLEKDIAKVLISLHEEHGHFATRITLGRAHGRVYWPTRAGDIGRWVASCEPCQRVTKVQKAGELKSVIQFKPLDMIGMDFVGPINPSCKATGFV